MEKIKDDFAHKAAEWDNPSKIKMTSKYVETLLRKVSPDEQWKTLEIGAGTGLVGLQILPLVKSVTFEDTSQAMLQVLKSKLTGNENIEIVHGELTDIKQGDFDFVVSCMAFHHIPDIAHTLSHLYQITKAGATVAIADIHTEDGSFHRFDPIPHTGFDTAELSEIFVNAGFEIVSVEDYNTLKREQTSGETTTYTQFMLIAHRKS